MIEDKNKDKSMLINNDICRLDQQDMKQQRSIVKRNVHLDIFNYF